MLCISYIAHIIYIYIFVLFCFLSVCRYVLYTYVYIIIYIYICGGALGQKTPQVKWVRINLVVSWADRKAYKMKWVRINSGTNKNTQMKCVWSQFRGVILGIV